jgi:chromosome segregation ATPase
MRGDIVSQSKRKAKTNLQSQFIDTVVKEIVEREFVRVEESLTSGMSTPILEKMRDITDGMKDSMKYTLEELANLKGGADDYTQRTTTEIEHLSTEVGMKPRVEVPKDIAEKLTKSEQEIDELKHELGLERQKLENRLKENDELRRNVAELKVRNDDLEDTLMQIQAAPKVDQDVLIELRQKIKTLEASNELQAEKIQETEARVKASELKATEYHGDISRKEVEIGDLKTKIRQLEEEMGSTGTRLAEMEELRSRLRSYESGDKARELERIKTEMERATANLERKTDDFEALKIKLTAAEETIEGYMGLMDSTEKTKAFLMVEDNGEMSIREIARALGVAPAIVMKWAEEFQTLGIAWVVDGTTLVHRDKVTTEE